MVAGWTYGCVHNIFWQAQTRRSVTSDMRRLRKALTYYLYASSTGFNPV